MIKRSHFVVVLVLFVAAGGAWWFLRGGAVGGDLVLYGNVDLRQVSLAFNSSDRVEDMLVKEGETVHRGQVIAKLDTSRLQPRVAQAEAEAAAQRAIVERMHNGSRPAEIDQAKANLASAKADAVNATLQYKRLTTLLKRKLASQQDVDSAKAAVDAAEARVDAGESSVKLLVAGPRKEDIVAAEAQLRASEAHLALLRRQVEDATLTAPVNGVIRARLLEPGEMASPERPVVSLAVMDPKWVRAYVTGEQLGRVQPGAEGYIQVDAFQNTRFDAHVGFISPVAEFTPKNVETADLRTSLVYEIRIFVDDPANLLRLGMPATVHLPSVEVPGDMEAPTTTSAPVITDGSSPTASATTDGASPETTAPSAADTGVSLTVGSAVAAKAGAEMPVSVPGASSGTAGTGR